MAFRRYIFGLSCLLLLFPTMVWAQGRAKQEAVSLAKSAKALFDQGRYLESAAEAQRASSLDPKVDAYRLACARALFMQRDYAACEAVLGDLMERKKPPLEAFRLLGNIHNERGNDYEALATYRRGLDLYKQAPELWMEMGILESARHQDSLALFYWEKGIENDPAYAGNYFFAARNHFAQGDYLWTLIYAEIFMNLERAGSRLEQMSLLIFDAYAKARHYDYKGVFQWRFEGERPNTCLHSAWNAAYTSLVPDTAWVPNINNISNSRRYASFYLRQRMAKKSVVQLLDWHQRIVEAGHWEAYSHWLLYDAERGQFFAWLDEHKADYEAFEAWYNRHFFAHFIKKPIVYSPC